MSDWTWVVASNLATFILGFATSRGVAVWEVRLMNHVPKADRVVLPSRRRSQRMLVILIVSFLVIAGFGVQQASYHNCVSGWAEDVTTVLGKRSSAGADVSDARAARDDSVDQILLVVATNTNVKDPARRKAAEKAFRDALSDFVAAKHALTEASAAQTSTQKAYPFPRLHCGW